MSAYLSLIRLCAAFAALVPCGAGESTSPWTGHWLGQEFFYRSDEVSYSSVWADFNEDGSGVYTSDGAYLMTRKTSDNLMWFGFFNDPARSDGPLCIMKDAGQALCSWSENYPTEQNKFEHGWQRDPLLSLLAPATFTFSLLP